jgi:hypothetical protein
MVLQYDLVALYSTTGLCAVRYTGHVTLPTVVPSSFLFVLCFSFYKEIYAYCRPLVVIMIMMIMVMMMIIIIIIVVTVVNLIPTSG